ncbi:MAG TPA: hypothetical protein VNO30_19250 [Kofleriaceae bacterium]|nr:hypothetical protein [Kofleriaceae bacterium]
MSPPFMPTVPFPSAASKARAARPPTDPVERAPTQAFDGETNEVERQELERREDSAMARLRAEGDATGLTELPPDFDSSAGEARSFGATDRDLPLVPPLPAPAALGTATDAPAEDDAEDDAAPAAAAAAAAAPAAARPDRLARGARAFGFKPAERAEAGASRPASAASAPEPQDRPETSPLIPPPAPSPPLAAAAAAASAASAVPDPSASGSMKLPVSTAPSSLPPPSEKQSQASGPSPACPQCEAPMAWVEEHLRFYCKSCKMYF